MREIKFRGKLKDNGEWVYGSYCPQCSVNGGIIHWIINIGRLSNVYSEVDPSTVGQYTGLKDKNGTEIYEGDIVMHHEGINKVIYKDGAYIAQFVLSYDLEWNESYYLTELENACEVIGNIHDNPELLEGA